MSLGFVYWAEEPDREREVVSLCPRCVRIGQKHGIKLEELAHVEIVSPQGVGHIAHELKEGYTGCGNDATGENWWWRE